MDEAKVAQERDNLIVETHERVLELRGATNLSIIEGHLYLFRTIKKRRVEPVSYFWGFYKTERQVEESETTTVGIIGSGEWRTALVDGVVVDNPAAGPGRKKKAK